MEIFHAESNTPEFEEFELLSVLIKDYDKQHYALPNS